MQASACAPRLARSALGSPSYILSARGRVMCTGRSNMRGRCRACSAASLRPSRPSHRYPRLPATLPHRRTRVRALPRPGAVTPADAPHRQPRHGKQPRLGGTASSETARSCTCAQSPSSESPVTRPRARAPLHTAHHAPPARRATRARTLCPRAQRPAPNAERTAAGCTAEKADAAPRDRPPRSAVRPEAWGTAPRPAASVRARVDPRQVRGSTVAHPPRRDPG